MSSSKQKRLAWLICGLGAVFYAYEYLLRIAPSAMEFSLRSHFNLSATGFGLLSAVYYYAYVPMQLPVGILMDRFGPRRLLTFACAICVIGTVFFCNTEIVSVAMVGRFLVGAGSAFAFVGVLKLATLWLPENKLAMVAGMTSALGTIGAMVGDNLLGVMIDHVGWVSTINYMAIIGVVLVFALWFFIKDHKRDSECSGTIYGFKQSLTDLSIILREKQVWVNGLYGCLVYLPTTVFGELWGIPYLSHAHGLNQSSAGFANSLLFFGFMIGAPLMGLLSDTLKKRKPPMIIGAIGASIMVMIILYVPDLNEHSIDLCMFVLGLFYSSQTIVFAVGRELSPNEAAGTAIAMTNMMVMVGALALQPLIGHLLDWSARLNMSPVLPRVLNEPLQQIYTAADYQLAMSVIPVGIIIAACLTYFIKETHAHAPS